MQKEVENNNDAMLFFFIVIVLYNLYFLLLWLKRFVNIMIRLHFGLLKRIPCFRCLKNKNMKDYNEDLQEQVQLFRKKSLRFDKMIRSNTVNMPTIQAHDMRVEEEKSVTKKQSSKLVKKLEQDAFRESMNGQAQIKKPKKRKVQKTTSKLKIMN
jgi:hypothetical protein